MNRAADEAKDRAGPTRKPSLVGELLRERMDDLGRNVTETSVQPGCKRGPFPACRTEPPGVSTNMALTLERIGLGAAKHWMRMQVNVELAQALDVRVALEKHTGGLQA